MLNRILRRFGINEGSAVTLSAGHINETYHIDAPEGQFILQAANSSVFRDPQLIMRNVEKIAGAFADSTEHSVRIPDYLLCNGKNYIFEDGKFWRIYPYIEKAVTTDDRRHGFAAGRFISVINSTDIVLEDPMPGLHDFAVSGVPKRNIHGDTKADNIILGRIFTTVIDLDTAKQGYVCADYGDMIRSITGNSPVNTALSRIDDATRGFSEGLDGMLTDAEVGSLFDGIILITEELAARYLGDVEGRTRDFPNRTIEKCRQRYEELKIQKSLFMKNEAEIHKIIDKYFK